MAYLIEEDVNQVKLKPPEVEWVEDEALLEKSIRHKKQWIDSFFIYSLIWSLGSMLKEQERKRFDTWLKAELNSTKHEGVFKQETGLTSEDDDDDTQFFFTQKGGKTSQRSIKIIREEQDEDNDS